MAVRAAAGANKHGKWLRAAIPYGLNGFGPVKSSVAWLVCVALKLPTGQVGIYGRCYGY